MSHCILILVEPQSHLGLMEVTLRSYLGLMLSMSTIAASCATAATSYVITTLTLCSNTMAAFSATIKTDFNAITTTAFNAIEQLLMIKQQKQLLFN